MYSRRRKSKRSFIWLIFILLCALDGGVSIFMPILIIACISAIILKPINSAFNGNSSQQSKTSQSYADTVHDTKAASKASAKKSSGTERTAGTRHKNLGKFLKIMGVSVSLAGLVNVINAIVDLLAIGLTGTLLRSILLSCVMIIGGGLSFLSGIKAKDQGDLYDKYAAIIGDRDSMLIKEIAAAIPTTPEKAAKDLQKLISSGDFGGKAYINSATGNFMRSAAAVPQKDPDLKQNCDASAEDANLSEGERTVRKIRRLNDEIPDPDISAQIDRIEELTADIFKLIEENPEKRPLVNKFLEYYLPTTLKLLSAYSKFDDAAASGENIEGAKRSIASILDTLTSGFAQQLDRLYASEAMDVDSDIRVLEQMMERDGLKTGKGSLDSVRKSSGTKPSGTAKTAVSAAAAAEQCEE